VAQCVLFFLAGYDTSATTMSFAVYNLACNPETQEKLYEEAKTLFESNVSLVCKLLFLIFVALYKPYKFVILERN